MILVLVLFGAGLLFSAFFSGSETGFYRMTRLRLVMEAATGDRFAKILLWLANQPTLFVATVLVGNNIANYLTSLAVVLGANRLFPEGGELRDVLAPIALAPLLFICGESLPKSLFHHAPNRLMRRVAPGIIACVVLFFPVTVVLWLLSLLLKLFSREMPQALRSKLARRELAQLMTEGHEAGLLQPVQRTLAQNMLALAGRPVRQFAAPTQRVPRVTTTMTRSEILRIAQRHRRTLLPIEEPRERRRLVGYVRVADLILGDPAAPLAPQPLVELPERVTYLEALEKLDQASDALGRVIGSQGETLGFVTGRELRLALFHAV